jgi:hypothetical protein
MNKIRLFLLLIFFSMNSYAYLDPGTGSLIIQSLIAAIAGGMYTIKIYWYSITDFFNKKDKKDKKNNVDLDILENKEDDNK